MLARMAPGRLVAFTPVDRPGGAETTLLRLLRALHARGWQTRLTTPGDGPLRRAALADGHGWRALPVGDLGRREGARAVASWPRARRLARAHDVVYVNGAVCGRLLPALPAETCRILHIHDMVRRVPPFWRRADLVLAASAAVARRLAEHGLGAEVVHPPVELDPPPKPPPWPDDGRPVIAFVGRIEPGKAPLDLARAASAIHAGAPHARIAIVGDDQWGRELDYVAAVRAAAAVEHYGWVDDAPGLMHHVDVLVLPSHEEGGGMVLAEAMAAGTPVVATRVDALPEVVDAGRTGLLVDPGAPDQIARAVLDVLGRRDAMGAAARIHARRFAIEAYADEVERLIAERADAALRTRRGARAPPARS